MTKINIKNKRLVSYNEIEKGDFFILEGLLYCKITDGEAFCTKDSSKRYLGKCTEVHLLESIDVTLV